MENNIVFICPSWEERSYLGFTNECEELPINEVVIIQKECPINGSFVSDCIDKISSYCLQKKIKCYTLIWHETIEKNWFSLEKDLNKYVSEEDMVYLDITTMPRDIIWSLLFFFYHFQNSVSIRYYQPGSYNDTWLCREPYSPRLLLKHSGIIELDKPQCVVIVTGFDVERTRQIVARFEPQKVVLCVQKGQQFNNSTRNKNNDHELICRNTGVTDVSSVEIDCYGEDFGKNTIDKIISSLSDYNVIIASFGPKPSAIGVYKAYQEHQEVALCYVPCREYNKDYCQGIGKLYTIDYK